MLIDDGFSWILRYEVYESLFPDREVVQVQINAIAIGGGGVHCITQQQPVAHGVFD